MAERITVQAAGADYRILPFEDQDKSTQVLTEGLDSHQYIFEVLPENVEKVRTALELIEGYLLGSISSNEGLPDAISNIETCLIPPVRIVGPIELEAQR